MTTTPTNTAASTAKAIDTFEATAQHNLDRIRFLRQSLAEEATAETTSSQMMLDAVTKIAQHEVAARMHTGAARIIANHGPADVREWATERLLDGADDRWSGRGNDHQRSQFDAVRDAVRDILRIVDKVEA